MTRIDRRRLLKFSGAGAVAASTGGMAAILASGRARAYGQATSLQWLKFVDFVPVSDQLLRGKITAECQKALGIKLNIETIEGNGIQARITSAIQSATGPDIIMAINNWPQLYGDSVADVSDVAGGDRQGRRRLLRDRKDRRERWQQMDRCAVHDPRRAAHKPQILLGGNRL
jgi:multiple sugar transport system substrate-binding protein